MSVPFILLAFASGALLGYALGALTPRTHRYADTPIIDSATLCRELRRAKGQPLIHVVKVKPDDTGR